MDEETFLHRVDPLFRELVEEEGDAYDDVIYRVDRPLRRGLVARVAGFLDRDAPVEDPDDGAPDKVLDQAIAEAHYPDTSPLLALTEEGFDLPLAVGVLHFYQPAYPLYRPGAVDALQELGYDVAYTEDLTEKGLETYRAYEQTIQDLTDRVHFRDFPEIHYYRQRVIEGALTATRNGAST